MLGEELAEPVVSAFRLLARSIEDETIGFEGQVYGEPFFPRNELESKLLFQRLCEDIDHSLVGDQHLRHYSWMSSGSKARECYHFSVDSKQLDYRVHAPDQNRNTGSLAPPNLFDRVIAPAIAKRMVTRHWSDFGTPRFITKGSVLLLNTYLVFRDQSIESFIESQQSTHKHGSVDYELIKYCRDKYPSWKERFIFCQTFAISTGRAHEETMGVEAVQQLLAPYVHSEQLGFQTYHLTVIHENQLRQGSCDEYKKEYVRLRVMQFQRDWGTKEKKQEDLQKMGWANGKAWAHEVKNYTGLISATLMPLQRIKQFDKGESLSRVKRATQGLLILNAVSCAVQLAFAKRSGATKGVDKNALEKLSRNKATAIIEAILQYLLNFYAEAKQSEFCLDWNKRISTEEAIQSLRTLAEPSDSHRRLRDDEVLTKSDFIWVIALLREVIGNIRLVNPTDDRKLVQISYYLAETKEEAIATIIQEQTEWAFETEKAENPEGIRMANDLFGKQGGAGFGEIEVKKPVLTELEDHSHKIRLEVEIRFAIA